jgi:hypothetical protein
VQSQDTIPTEFGATQPFDPSEQLNGQAERINMAERRLQELERRLASGQLVIEQSPYTSPLTTSQPPEEDTGQELTQPLVLPTNLPPGSIRAAHFADRLAMDRRTFRDQIRAGKVRATTINTGGKSEHWLTPEQQAQVLFDTDQFGTEDQSQI